MATPVGVNAVNSLSRRILHPQLIDQVYQSGPLFARLVALNKKMQQGGYQIEVPQVYSRFTAGGPFQGFDTLDISPSDTVKNAAWDWRQYYVPITVDELTLARWDHPEAVASGLSFLFEQAEAEMYENLVTGCWSDAITNSKAIDGLKGAVDDGTVASTYGGLSRTTNPWWKSQIDSTTTTLTTLSMRTIIGNATVGGRHPTVIFTTQFLYNRYWNLIQPSQAWPIQPQGADEQKAQAGFSNLVFDMIPIIVDSHVPANHLFFLNERYLYLFVKTGWDMKLNDFIQPPNQFVYTSLLGWFGQLVLANPARSGKMTAVTG